MPGPATDSGFQQSLALAALQQNAQAAQQNAMLNGLFHEQLPQMPTSLPPDLSGKAAPTPSWLDILQARGAQLGTDQVDPGVTYGGLK
jgi:hypothetical protein